MMRCRGRSTHQAAPPKPARHTTASGGVTSSVNPWPATEPCSPGSATNATGTSPRIQQAGWLLHRKTAIELPAYGLTVALETGDLEVAAVYGGGYDRWIRHVREVTNPLVQQVSQVCMAGGAGLHVDPGHRSPTPSRRSAPREPIPRLLTATTQGVPTAQASQRSRALARSGRPA